MNLEVVDISNKKVASLELGQQMSEKPDQAVLYYALKALRNNLRRGTAKVKDRSEITKSNHKIYRQKGTGRARHGARRANIFVGGASTHGPRPRSYFEKLNKKFKKRSYLEAFKYLAQHGGLKVVSEIKFDRPSTRSAAKVLNDLNLTEALVILPKENQNAFLSFRNLKNVHVVSEENLNVYDLLCFSHVIITADFFNKVKERYGL